MPTKGVSSPGWLSAKRLRRDVRLQSRVSDAEASFYNSGGRRKETRLIKYKTSGMECKAKAKMDSKDV